MGKSSPKTHVSFLETRKVWFSHVLFMMDPDFIIIDIFIGYNSGSERWPTLVVSK